MAEKPTPTVADIPDTRMVLVPYNKGRQIRRRFLLLVILLIAVAAGFYAGYSTGVKDQENAVTERDELVIKKSGLENKVIALQEQVAIYKHGSELEKQATERVRQENIQLQNRVSELAEAVAFYKGVMAPEKNDKGLRIEKATLEATKDPGRVRYKIVLTQVADNRSYVSGRVKINVLGVENGEKKTLSVATLSKDMESDGTKFKFRYFQDIVGEFQIPDGFVPEHIEVIAQSKGRKAMRLEKKFDWLLEEVKSDVGQGKI
ncbi:MAG: hypothetical protein CSA49_06100 [Gammaproteobacteria bacterium]|nr:MAG: hypothetical protein CSA49_06100 [Gammaproteobacteria bacterium]